MAISAGPNCHTGSKTPPDVVSHGGENIGWHQALAACTLPEVERSLIFVEPSPQVYWSPITEEGKSHWTRPEVEEAVIRKPVVASPRFSFTPPEDETASIELHFPSTVSSTLPEAESVLILSVSLTAILRP